MPLTSVSTTEMKWECPHCATEDTHAIAVLEAGSRSRHGGKHMIILPACSSCGTVTGMIRTTDNPRKEALAIDGLHSHLVGLDQIHTTKTSELRGTVDTDDFTGTGLDDLTKGGYYLGEADDTYQVVIESTGTPDVIKWRKGVGSWTTGVNITGALQIMAEGVGFTFAATTGHTVADLWDLDVSAEAGKPTVFYEITATPKTYTRASSGHAALDCKNVVEVIGTKATQALIEQNVFYTDDGDADIADLVNALYTEKAHRTAATAIIKAKRLAGFGI